MKHQNAELEEVTDLSDERLEPFREIRNRNWTEKSGIFIAEGPILVEQLLASTFECQSLLLDRKHADRLNFDLGSIPQVFLLDNELVDQLVGFNFHRGCMACGKRKTALTVQEFVGQSVPSKNSDLMVALVGIQDPENLGSILRSCAAFGAQNVLLGPGTADPFGRRALRVSMGTSFSLSFLRSNDFRNDVLHLAESGGYSVFATSLKPKSTELAAAIIEPGKNLLVFGNERRGIPADILSVIENEIRIKMHLGTDSLNVGVAAGIILHHFSQKTLGADAE